MKKILLISSLILSAVVCINSYAKESEESLDQTVAIVNDDVVTKTELRHAITTTKMQIAQEREAMPSDDKLKKQVLDQLIDKKLELQIARQSGMQVTKGDLDKTIKRIADQNHMTVDEFYARLHQEGFSTADYRSEMHDQILMQKLQQQEVVGKITVSPQEITTFMKSRSWQDNNAIEYHLDDLLVPVSDTPSPQEVAAAKQHAETVLAKLNQGQSFQAIVQSENGSQHAVQSGDLGWRKLAEVPTAFTDQVGHMKLHAIAGPIQTPNGFHIIRLTDTRSTSDTAMPTRKMVQDMLMQKKYETAVQNWVSKLRGQAFIVTNPDK